MGREARTGRTGYTARRDERAGRSGNEVAKLYRKKQSRYWWCRGRDAAGKRWFRSTKQVELRAAQFVADEIELEQIVTANVVYDAGSDSSDFRRCEHVAADSDQPYLLIESRRSGVPELLGAQLCATCEADILKHIRGRTQSKAKGG